MGWCTTPKFNFEPGNWFFVSKFRSSPFPRCCFFSGEACTPWKINGCNLQPSLPLFRKEFMIIFHSRVHDVDFQVKHDRIPGTVGASARGVLFLSAFPTSPGNLVFGIFWVGVWWLNTLNWESKITISCYGKLQNYEYRPIYPRN